MAVLVAQKITVMFIILALGVLCFHKGLLDSSMNGKLSNFLLQVVNPIVIFVSYQIDFDPSLLRNLGIVLILSAAGFVLQILAAKLLLPQKSPDWAIERLSAVYGNCGFIGIPLINELFGREGVFYMTAYLTVFYLFFWTHGVLLMTGKNSARETMKNLLSPAVIGVIMGLACFLLQIHLPQLFVDALDSVGSMNTPLAMLVAGATLGQAGLRSLLQRPRAYYVSFLKLEVVPALTILILAFLQSPEAVKVTLILASGCPVGACCTMFALQYKKDGEYASVIFTVSTVLAGITLPALIALSEILGILSGKA